MSKFLFKSRRRALGLASAWLLGGPAEAATEEIWIGSSAAFSGPAAALGQRFHAGAQACFRQLNQKGGIRGAQLRVRKLDDAYEPKRAEQNTRELVEDPRVLALFGYVGAPTSHAALPFVRRAQLPFVAAFSGAEILFEPNPWIFNVRASYREEAKALAAAMKADGVNRLGVLYQGDLFGRSGLEAMRAAIAPEAISLGAIATVQRNTEEVQASAALLLAPPQPDAIFMVSTYATSAAFVRQAQQLGFQGRFYSLSFAGLEPLREALAQGRAKLTIAQVVPDPEDRGIPVVQAYQKAMREAGDKQLDTISLEGYLAARVLVEGLHNSQFPLTRERLAQGLAGLGHQDLGGFSVDYGPQLRKGSSYIGLKSGLSAR